MKKHTTGNELRDRRPEERDAGKKSPDCTPGASFIQVRRREQSSVKPGPAYYVADRSAERGPAPQSHKAAAERLQLRKKDLAPHETRTDEHEHH